MTKFPKLKAAAAVAGACAALFAAAPANAFVYAVSKLDINNLNIGIFATGTTTPDVGAATNYAFTLSNKADFAANGPATYAANTGGNSCTGNAAAGTTLCNTGPGAVLDAPVANAPGLMAARADNNFAVLGSNTTQSWSNADSQITTAKLVQPSNLTNTAQIAESLLNVNGVATGNTEVKSTTTLRTDLLFGGITDLVVTFDALLAMMGQISETSPMGFYTSQAGSNLTLNLTKNGGGGSWIWTPDGTVFGCNGAGILGSTCTESADNWNLNGSDSISGNPDSFDLSSGGFRNFGLTIAGLAAGSYSLSLTANTTTLVDRTVIPEPGSLALVGLALAGLGFAGSKRRNRASK